MNDIITYQRTGRKRRATGKIIDYGLDGTKKVLPQRDGWKPIWVFPWEMNTGDIPRRKPMQRSAAMKTAAVIKKCRAGAKEGTEACTCTFFRIRANSNFRRHRQHIPYAPKRTGVSECCHIRAAWDYYHVHVTIPMMASFKNGITNQPTTT